MNILEFSLDKPAQIEEGSYEYRIADVICEYNVATAYGFKKRITLVFEVTDNDQVSTITQKFYHSSYPESRFMKFMEMVCTAYHVRKLNITSLVDTSGSLTIQHSTDEQGNTYANVTSLTVSVGIGGEVF